MINIASREDLVADLAALARETVDKQSGITGMALKGALSAATKMKANVVEAVIGQTLDQLLEVLGPYWDSKPEGASFAAHLEPHKEEIAQKLQDIADDMAKSQANPSGQKVYQTVRGKAFSALAEQVPAIGAAVEKNAAK